MARKTKSTRKAKRAEDDSEHEQATIKSARRASGRAPRQDGGRQNTTKSAAESDDADSGEASDAYVDEDSDKEEESDAVLLDSDELDDSDFDASTRKRRRAPIPSKTSPKKKGRTSSSSPKKARGSPAKKRRKASSDDEEEDMELKDGQEVVGTVVQAPKTGRVPPGQISQNTFNFLKQLQDPKYNDRIWFKLHEPVFRQAEKEWKDFIDELTPLLTEADPQIPVLPPNDVVHRIYRDVRFSNDKTPYKTNFSGSFSRSGRKGTFAGYHISIKPGGSLVAAGTWCPGKTELQTIRSHITRSSRHLRQLISAPAFVGLFGEPKPHPQGQRRNIFGMEDELKVAPKGVDKHHKDIDLLKCRSFAVVHSFTDAQVRDPDLKQELKRIFTVVRPFVHGLNYMMTFPPDEEGSEGEGEGGEDGEDDA